MKPSTKLTFVVLIFFYATMLSAQPISVSLPPDASADSGLQVIIPINTGDVTGQNVISYQAIVTYNANVLSCTGASNTGTLTQSWGPPFANCGTGQVTLGGFGTTAISGSGILVNLEFDVIGSPGDSTELTFTTFIFNSGTPASTAANGLFRVNVPNYPPEIAPLSNQSMSEASVLNMPVAAGDPNSGDILSLSAENVPGFGSFTDDGNGDGSFTFSPGFEDAGIYNIRVIACDNGSPALCDTAEFTLTVLDSNRAPVLSPISNQSMNEGDTLYINISAHDPDGDILTYTTTNLPPFATILNDTTICFMPGFSDAGDYTNIQAVACDNGSPVLCDTAIFMLTVANTNRAPIAVNDTTTTAEDNAITIMVVDNDSDPDGDPLSILFFTSPSNGSADTSGGNIIYTPEENYNGSDMFSYQVGDGEGGTATADVHISISPVNDHPEIINLPDSLWFNVGSDTSVNIWEWVSDIESHDSTLSYHFTADNDSLLRNYNSATGILLLANQPGFHGTVYMGIKVTDPDSAMVLDTIKVIIHFVTGIETTFSESIPISYQLMQNFPNPFNPSTTIRFGLPAAAKVTLTVYNMLGQQVAILSQNQPFEAGYHQIRLEADKFASGIYFYRIEAGKFLDTKKMILMK